MLLYTSLRNTAFRAAKQADFNYERHDWIQNHLEGTGAGCISLAPYPTWKHNSTPHRGPSPHLSGKPSQIRTGLGISSSGCRCITQQQPPRVVLTAAPFLERLNIFPPLWFCSHLSNQLEQQAPRSRQQEVLTSQIDLPIRERIWS